MKADIGVVMRHQNKGGKPVFLFDIVTVISHRPGSFSVQQKSGRKNVSGESGE